jgi:hypothetical protein
MKVYNTLAALLLAAVLMHITSATVRAGGWENETGDERGERAERESELYDDAMDYVDDEKYDKAVKAFAKVVEMKGSRADGALFWTAYSLNRMGRRTESLQTIAQLTKSYPNSKWINDAKALEIEVRGGKGESVAPERVDDEELKVIAINSLMHTDPEKAYPLLQKILSSGKSAKKIKEQAMFILSQSSSPRSQALLADIARGKANPDLQREAIKYLGISGGSRNNQLLAELYAAETAYEVKKEILNSFMISGDKARVLEAAKNEKNSRLRKDAINLLGVMGGRAELAAMYANEPSRDLREEVINAMFIAGDYNRLADIARTEKDVKLRTEAIRRVGLMGGKTSGLLLTLYNSESDMEVKKAVIDGLFLQGNSRALIDLAKKEKNRELKREALQKLSVMGDEEAIAYMLEILDE